MSIRAYGFLTSGLFAVIGLIHLLRALFGWAMIIGTWTVPLWLSIVAAVVLAFLSYAGCRVAREIQTEHHRQDNS